MITHFKFTLLLFIVPLSCFAGGGHTVGNGGVLLKCLEDDRVYYKSYDLAELSILTSEKPLYSDKKNYLEKSYDIIGRLTKINPNRKALYESYVHSFLKEAHFLPRGVRLDRTEDIAFGLFPKNCEIVQAIVQKDLDLVVPGKRFIIDVDIWDALDENTKAALVVHEVIYREALEPQNGHTHSIYTRKLNQLLHSTHFSELTLEGYHNFLYTNHFSTADAQNGISISLFDPNLFSEFPRTYWSPEKIRTARLAYKNDLIFKNQAINYNCLTPENSRGLYFNVNLQDSLIAFYENGNVESMNLKCAKLTSLNLNFLGFSGEMDVNYIKFDKDFNITEAGYTENFIKKNLTLNIHSDIWQLLDFDQSFVLIPYSYIRIDSKLSLYRPYWLKNGTFQNQFLKKILLDKNNPGEFVFEY